MSQELVELIIDKDKFEPRYVEDMIQTSYGYRKDRKVVIQSNGSKYVMKSKSITRLCQFLGLRRRQFNRLAKEKGSVEASNTLKKQWDTVGLSQYKILVKDNSILRITSIEYIGVPHSFVQQEIEARLKVENIEWQKHIKHDGAVGFYTLMNMKSKEEGIVPTLHYFNKNSGDKSIKFNGGGMVLVCSNGMTVEKGGIKIRIIHRMELSEIKTKINTIIGTLLEKIEEIPKAFTHLKKYKITMEDAKKKIDDELIIPKYLKNAVKLQLEKGFDGTMWSVYMATTYVGTHLTELPKKKGTIEMSEDQSRQLQSLELITPLIQVKQK